MATVISLKRRAYSLIELLIVVLIIAILSQLALSSYRVLHLKTGRSEAIAALMNAAWEQQKFFASFNRYSLNVFPLNPNAQLSTVTATGLYKLEVQVCDQGSISYCFEVIAEAQGAQAQDKCTRLSIDSYGRRRSLGDKVENCWR